jgi:ATP-dependent phosphoenolpyruvate carboxykinase
MPDLLAAGLDSATFVGIHCRGAGLLPPVARLEPLQAVALLLTHSSGHPIAVPDDGGAPAGEALRKLGRAGCELYALKHGWVGGPEGSPGAVAISAELVAAVLDGALAGAVEWELDPDFGYQVAAAAPGVEAPEAEALCPRLLYAAAGRVYEHAELVALIKAERRAALGAIPGLDPAIVSALG